jgi:putative transposase
MNRSAKKLALFEGPHDYDAFVRILGEAEAHLPMRLLCYVVMPNHWHLVLWPVDDGDLSKYLRWVTVTHAVRWHRARGSVGTGAVYQGRFKAIPVQSDVHFLSVCRYVERNPVRAGLAASAMAWPWSSSAPGRNEGWPTLHPWPLARPSSWHAAEQPVHSEGAEDEIRRCVRQGLPFGAPEWRAATARALGLSTRGRGRPVGPARGGTQ